MAQVFKTLRWLRPYKSKSGHQIFIRVRLRNGLEINVPVYDYVNHEKIPISVQREHWNKGFITGGIYHISVRDLNNLLTKVEHNVKFAINELIEKNIRVNQENIVQLAYINEINALENERKIASGEVIVDEQGGAFASQDEFEEFIADSDDPKFDTLKKAMGIYKKEYILDFWDDFIKEYAPDSYNTPRHSIQEYINNTQDNCKVTEFSSAWLERFFKHIIREGYSYRKDGENRKPYTITTVVKYLKHLRAFGDYLFAEKKLIDNQDYNRFDLKKKTKKQSLIKYHPEPYINTHALYKKEFDYFYYYKFEDAQHEKARDMFILQTWLGGLRQVDFYKLTKDNIYKDSDGLYRVWFGQQKTEGEVINKINQHYLVPIFEKYSDGLPQFLEVHDYNDLLKIATEKAGLNRKLKFRYEYANANDATEEWTEIHKMISNNWARNCAVSILCELGYPDYRIAKFTGHKDLEMINHYKKIHPKEVDTMINEVKPEFVKELIS
jgi:integrase